MDNPFQSPAILSLCTGMRGLERGIERAIGPVRTELILEIEAFIIENLVRQMEQGVLAPTPIWSNIKTFDARPFRGMVDGIMGGYPCQGFSVAGKQLGTEDPRHLWPYIFGIIGTIRPVWCFFENVPGHVTIGYREVRSQLQSIGYKIEQGIFSAAEVGAPHNRKRLFILALRLENTADNGFKRCIDAAEISGRFNSLPVERAGIMDNSHGIRHEQEHKISTGRNGIISSGEMANPEHDGRSPSEISGSIGTRNGGDKEGKDSALQSEGCGELADTISARLERYSGNEHREGWKGIGQSGSITKSGISLWPAGPGQEQHEWEAPRVESSLGFTVNGYNFREDLLRMAGNGVVEQTAELAFRTLLNKFL